MSHQLIREVGGMLPAWDDRYLPINQASFARNSYLYSGTIMGWREPKLLRSLTNPAAKYTYRVPTITQGVAAANLAFVSAPLEGDTVSLGEAIYKFTATVTTAYDVLIGSDAQKSSQNLFLAAVFGAQDTAICGIATLPNADISTRNPYLGFPFSATATTNTPGGNVLVLVKVTPSGTQKLTDISFMPAGTSAGAKFKGVIYNNVNSIQLGGTTYVDQPSTIMAIGNETIGCISGTPVVSHLGVGVTLIGGDTYWIGIIMDTAVAFALASSTSNAITLPAAYASGPPNPLTGTGVSPPPINTGQPNFQIWGSMALLTSTDTENTVGANDFGTGSLPYIGFQAPDFGASYNTIPVASSSSRLVWVHGLTSLLSPVTFLSGGLNQTADLTIGGIATWLEFVDPDTNVMKSPVVDDSFQRFYFASPTQVPEYNTYARIAAAQPNFLLGIPAPGCAPGVTPSGGGNATTLGFATTSSAGTAAFTPKMLYLTKVFAPGAQSINDISANITSSGAAMFAATGVFVGLVYADNNGVPGALLGQANVPTTAAPGTLVSSFTNPVALLANTSYWIGAIFYAPGEIQLSDDSGTAGSIATFPLNIDGPVSLDPAPTMTSGQQDWQIWADCTVEAQLESRAYVYTWVSEYGEEGPPSPPTLADGWDNGLWTIDVFSPLPEEMGITRNIAQTNIYRTVSGQQGQTVYYLVASSDVGLATYVDAATDNIIAENLQLPSTNWFPPPANLQGMLAMPNGMAVGFKGNEIWFSEPYRPHAWPSAYVITTDFPIIGLGVTGMSVVACTATSPQVCTGTRPATMSTNKINFPKPCLSRGSIISTHEGVYYSSIDGLIKVDQNAIAANVSQSWITREKWDKYTPSKYIRAVPLISMYFAMGSTAVLADGSTDTSVAQEGFTMELAAQTDGESFTIWPQPGGHRIGFNTMTAPGDVDIDNVLVDPWTANVMLIQGGKVYYYDFSDQAPVITPTLWRSKKFEEPYKSNYAALRVWFDIPPGGPQTPPATLTTADPTYTSSTGLPFVSGMFGVVRVLVDGRYVMERELRFSSQLMRLPSGFKGTTWQIEVEGIMSVTAVKLATSTKELAMIAIPKGNER